MTFAEYRMQSEDRQVHVFIVSDATGATAERVINAALVQFDGISPVFKKFPFTKTTGQMADILTQAQELDAIVIYSLVSQEIRQWIRANRHEWRIYLIDILGPILKNMQRLWDIIPKLRPGILGGIGEETYRLADSIDYTLKHDDGQNIDTIGQADLVIVGLSRTSKTPTSLYLACNHNLKVANIPVIQDVPLPEAVQAVHAPVIGLRIEANRLALLRGKRFLSAQLVRKICIYPSQIFHHHLVERIAPLRLCLNQVVFLANIIY